MRKEESKKILSDSLTFGPVELNVQDIESMENFYSIIMGLDVLKHTPTKIVLGLHNNPLVILNHREDLPASKRSDAGLYHFAIVYSSRGDLARTIYTILKLSPQSFAGTGDHLVSEAFYFTDPEGNGIELYFDRPRNEWQWENGQIKMAALYIDPAQYLQKYIPVEETNTTIQIGHIHLKVGDIEEAKKFYVDTVGFVITASMPHALFISVGGYHHHFGLNIWESQGAGKRTDSLGLKNFECMLPQKKDLENLKNRLQKDGVPFEDTGSQIIFNDPWNNTLRVYVL